MREVFCRYCNKLIKFPHPARRICAKEKCQHKRVLDFLRTYREKKRAKKEAEKLVSEV